MARKADDIVSRLPLVLYDIIGGHNGFVNPIKEPRLHVLQVKWSLESDVEDRDENDDKNKDKSDEDDADRLNDVEDSTDTDSTDDTDTDVDDFQPRETDQIDIGEAFQLFLNDGEFVIPCILSSQMQYIVHGNECELCEGSVVRLLDYEVLTLEKGQDDEKYTRCALIKDLEVLYSPLNGNTYSETLSGETSSRKHFNKLFKQPEASRQKCFRPPSTVEDVVDEAFQEQERTVHPLQSRSHEFLSTPKSTSGTSGVTRSHGTRIHRCSEQKVNGFGFKLKGNGPHLKGADNSGSNLSQLIDDMHIASPQKYFINSTNSEPSKIDGSKSDYKPVPTNLSSRNLSEAFQESQTVPPTNRPSVASTYQPVCYSRFKWKFPPRITSLKNLSSLVNGSKLDVLAIVVSISNRTETRRIGIKRNIYIQDHTASKATELSIWINPKNFTPPVGTLMLFRGMTVHDYHGRKSINAYEELDGYKWYEDNPAIEGTAEVKRWYEAKLLREALQTTQDDFDVDDEEDFV